MNEPRIKQILVPVDFLDMTEHVIEHATYMARLFGAEVKILHVVHVPPLSEASTWLDPVISPSVEQDMRVQMTKVAREKLGEIVEKCKSRGVNAEALVREGTPFAEILEVADEIQADLVVMGSQGRTGLSHFLMGSVAERVVRRAHCNVLCIKPGSEDQE